MGGKIRSLIWREHCRTSNATTFNFHGRKLVLHCKLLRSGGSVCAISRNPVRIIFWRLYPQKSKSVYFHTWSLCNYRGVQFYLNAVSP